MWRCICFAGRTVAALSALTVLLTPQSASADAYPVWLAQTTDKGCIAYSFETYFEGMESEPRPPAYVWAGPQCTAGQPINGEGALIEMNSYPSEDGWDNYVLIVEGRWINGILDGPVTLREYEVDANGRIAIEQPLDVPDQNAYSQKVGGCAAYQIESGECSPGKVEAPVRIPQVRSPYFEVPDSLVARFASAQPGSVASAAEGGNEVALPSAEPDQTNALYGSYGNPMEVGDASDCLVYRAGIGGGMLNRCSYPVVYEVCILNPQSSTGAWFPCIPGKGSGGLWFADADQVPVDTKSEGSGSGSTFYWFACRYDLTDGPQFFDMDKKKRPVFQPTEGLVGGCVTWAEIEE